MSDDTTHIFTPSAFLDEAAKVGCSLDAAKLERFMDLRLLPTATLGDGTVGLPMLALASLADATSADAAQRAPILREQAEVFTTALRGDAVALRATYRRLRHHIASRAVLGELHRMLPVLEASALDTLRGDARLEWRLRQTLNAISARIASNAFLSEDPPEALEPEAAQELSPPLPAEPDAFPELDARPTRDLGEEPAESARAEAATQAWERMSPEPSSDEAEASKPVVTSFSALREAVDHARRRAAAGDAVRVSSDSGASKRVRTAPPERSAPAAEPGEDSGVSDEAERWASERAAARRDHAAHVGEESVDAAATKRVGRRDSGALGEFFDASGASAASPAPEVQESTTAPLGRGEDAVHVPADPLSDAGEAFRREPTRPGSGAGVRTSPAEPHRAETPRQRLDRALATLAAAPEDAAAQKALLRLMRSEDVELARRAWAGLSPALRAGANAEALLDALLVMAERETSAREKTLLLSEAANVAEGRLRDHERAFDLLLRVLSADPGRGSVADRAVALAEAYGWWAPLVEGLEAAAGETGDTATIRRLLERAADLAEQKLNDLDRAASLRRELIDHGIVDDATVQRLVQTYRDAGKPRDAVQLLVRMAQREDGEARVEGLVNAAELAASDLDAPADALQLFEQALLHAGGDAELRERYAAAAAEWGLIDRALEFLTADAADSSVERALRKATIARTQMRRPEAAARVLRAALPEAGPRRDDMVLALCDALGDAEKPAEQVAVLREAIEQSGDAPVAFVLRLAEAHGALGRTDAARDALQRRLAERAPEREVVDALAAIHEASSSWDALIDLYATCADSTAGDGEVQRDYIRGLAEVAAERLDDDETAIALLEEAVDASGADAGVLLQLATRCRRIGDERSEMAALERIFSQGDARALTPEQLLRLAELLMSLPRGAVRAAEVLEQVLDSGELSDVALTKLERLMPEVTEASGKHALMVRWLRRQVESTTEAREAARLWAAIADCQARSEMPAAEQLEALERALESATGAGVDHAGVAPLHMHMATARVAMGQWERAYEHASQACAAFLEADPKSDATSSALDLLADIVRVMPEHDEALRWLRRGAREGGVDDVLRYAQAAIHTRRWSEAIPALESLLGRPDAFDPDTLAQLQDDLARAYRRAPRT